VNDDNDSLHLKPSVASLLPPGSGFAHWALRGSSELRGCYTIGRGIVTPDTALS